MKKLSYFFCFPQGGFNDFCEIIWLSFDYCKKFDRILVIDTRYIITFKDDFRNYIIINDPLVYTGDIDILFHDLKLNDASFYPKISNKLSDFGNINQITKNFVWKKQGIYFNEYRCSFPLDKKYEEKVLFYSTVKGCSNISNLLQISKIESTLQSKIQTKYKSIPKDYVAIHIRNTDYSSNFTKFHEEHKYLLENKNIFLATDDYNVVEYFKKIYKERLFHFSNIPSIIIRNKRGFHYDNKVVSSKTMIEDCISDFLLCCLAENYYYSCEKSSFSKNVELVRECNQNLLNSFK